MPPDRPAIDLPLVRRGYDPAAVDAHLADLADRIDVLERRAAAAEAAAATPPASAGRTASEQVRGIVEAAERSAADIELAAREDADRIRAEASARATAVLERVDAVEQELGRVLDAARAAALRLAAEAGEAPGEAGEAPAGAAPIVAAPTGAAPVEVEATPAEAGAAAAAGDVAAERGAAAAPAAGDDAAAARLVALDMALSGRSREETDRVLGETFGPADRDELLDEVWAALPR